MDFLTEKVNEFKTLAVAVFMLILIVVAIKLLAERKMLAIILFLVAAGLLGWLVLDPNGAVTTLKGIFS
ncbi:TcpD family membrane protein [Acetivibrio cellulolyticus]|uniref:TcpD family membrane protein n=1 Tax=Acetivibrio cellulolyticus TaxID=35830 RepID=UPI0001E2C2F1|nr:TcpD family membrane protein [Acetivibrio cellulolyticus]